MPTHLLLADAEAREDLRVYLQRLDRVGEAEVRIVTRGRALAVYGCTRPPRGIASPGRVVLVMRAFALEDLPGTPIDATVQLRGLLDRLARLGITDRGLDVPEIPAFAAWAGVLPPVSGWAIDGAIDATSLSRVARQGIERVAAALPDQPGDALVQKVRDEVWGMDIAQGVPAAAAFAAETMGFLGTDPARLTRSGAWIRLSTSAGSVLVH